MDPKKRKCESCIRIRVREWVGCMVVLSLEQGSDTMSKYLY